MKKLNIKSFKQMNQKWYKQNIVVALVCLILLSSLSIGYAALQQNLDVGGEVTVRGNEKFIIDVEYDTDSTCGFEVFNPRFDTDSFTVSFELPELECIVVYKLTVQNTSSSYMEITDLIKVNYNNPSIVYSVAGLTADTSIFVMPNSTEELKVTFRYSPELTELPDRTTLAATLRLVWTMNDDLINEINVAITRNVFIVTENINIKDFLTVTAIINNQIRTLRANEYEVTGFSTATAGENLVLTVRYRDLTVTRLYNVIALSGFLFGDGSHITMTHQVLPSQINLTFTFNGQLQTFWYYYSENIVDMIRPHAQMLPRLTGTGSAGNRVINAPLNPNGTLRSGYYYVYGQRNGNLHDVYAIIIIP